jgi:hypothetical protein
MTVKFFQSLRHKTWQTTTPIDHDGSVAAIGINECIDRLSAMAV